jgi:hypothetical protein
VVCAVECAPGAAPCVMPLLSKEQGGTCTHCCKGHVAQAAAPVDGGGQRVDAHRAALRSLLQHGAHTHSRALVSSQAWVLGWAGSIKPSSAAALRASRATKPDTLARTCETAATCRRNSCRSALSAAAAGPPLDRHMVVRGGCVDHAGGQAQHASLVGTRRPAAMWR